MNNFDPFSFRSGEQVTIHPDSEGKTTAVCWIKAELPEPSLKETPEGPVESAAILAATLQNGVWQWCHLAPYAKELIGDMIVDVIPEKEWWYLTTD